MEFKVLTRLTDERKWGIDVSNLPKGLPITKRTWLWTRHSWQHSSTKPLPDSLSQDWSSHRWICPHQVFGFPEFPTPNSSRPTVISTPFLPASRVDLFLTMIQSFALDCISFHLFPESAISPLTGFPAIMLKSPPSPKILPPKNSLGQINSLKLLLPL